MKCEGLLNSSTKRCVKASGRVGRSLKNPQKCKLVYNSQTKRCNKVKEIKVLPKFRKLLYDCSLSKVWKKSRKVGSGAYGNVYLACHYNDCEYVMKVQQFNEQAKAEIDAYMSLKNIRVLPKMFAAWICRGKMYMVLEKLKICECSPTVLIKKVETLLEKMLHVGWLHGDIHPGNVMCTQNNRVLLIDFGFSMKKGKWPYKNNVGDTFGSLKKLQMQQLCELRDDLLC